MATNSPMPGADTGAATANIDSAASARFDQAVQGLSSGPGSGEPVVTGSSAEQDVIPAAPPGSEPGAPPQAAPGSEPAAAQPGVAPSGPPENVTIEVEKLDPEARAFLGRYGYNVEQALAEALRNGNLVATLTRERRMGAWTSPTPSAPQAPAMEAPLPIAQVPYEAIETQARSILDRDRFANDIVRDGMQLRNEYANLVGDAQQGIPGRIPKLSAEIAEIQSKLSVEEIQADPLKSQDLGMKLITKQGELLRLENRQSKIERDYDALNGRYRARFEEAKQHVTSKMDSAYNEYASRQAYEAEYNSAADEIIRVWPGAIDRAVAESKIPATMVPHFKAYAKLHANAYPEDIPDVEAFVRAKGKEFATMTVEAHRAMSGTYGALATGRQEAVAGQPGMQPAAAPPASNPNTLSPSDPLRDVYRRAEMKWAGLFQR
jgi:hypothetical protein